MGRSEGSQLANADGLRGLSLLWSKGACVREDRLGSIDPHFLWCPWKRRRRGQPRWRPAGGKDDEDQGVICERRRSVSGVHSQKVMMSYERRSPILTVCVNETPGSSEIHAAQT